MFKALLLELIRPYLEDSTPSWMRCVVYCLALIALGLLIAANYFSFYSYNDANVIVLIRSATISIMITIFIETIRCYLKHRNSKHPFNRLKVAGKELVKFSANKTNNLADWKRLFSTLPVIIRIVPTSILTFIIYKSLKRAVTHYFYKK